MTCDFEEEHICGWQSDSTADFNWLRNRGKTRTTGTGPSVDVTTGTRKGYYMYIETSSPQKEGEKARLISPVESVSGFHNGLCLYFYYHAYGRSIGSMNMYSIKETDYQGNRTSSSLNPLWTIDTALDDQWYLASVSTDFKDDYRIVFEGVVGNSVYGDVAIDDLFLSARSCPVPGNCDFENGDFEFCSWMNSESDDLDWTIYSPTIAAESGDSIINDNTLGDENGRFMIASGKPENRVAKIFSEKLVPTSSSGDCLSFYFYFNGGNFHFFF